MITAFKNKVFLLYLPLHTSHKTQPLDRSIFRPLKTYYRQLTASLSKYRSSALANKQRFLLAYREARRKGFTKRNIRSGFKKAGIWPLNPSVVLDDPEALIGDSPPPPERPRTLKLHFTTAQTAFITPKKSLDILRVLNNARGYVSPSRRDVRGLLTKLGKALDQANAERVLMRAEIKALKED